MKKLAIIISVIVVLILLYYKYIIIGIFGLVLFSLHKNHVVAPTPKEVRTIVTKNDIDYSYRIQEIFSNNNYFNPGDSIKHHDSIVVSEGFMNFFNKDCNYLNKSLLYQDSLRKVIGRNGFPQDSINKIKFCKTLDGIKKTGKVEYIRYCNDNKHILIFYSFDYYPIHKTWQVNGGKCLSYIGTKSDNSITIHSFYRMYPSPYNYENKSVAFRSLFFYEYLHIPLWRDDFWNNEFLFKKHKVENENVYGYSVAYDGFNVAMKKPNNDSLKWKLKKSLFLIKYTNKF